SRTRKSPTRQVRGRPRSCRSPPPKARVLSREARAFPAARGRASSTTDRAPKRGPPEGRLDDTFPNRESRGCGPCGRKGNFPYDSPHERPKGAAEGEEDCVAAAEWRRGRSAGA